MIKILSAIKIFFLTLIFFIFLDLLIGNYIYKKFIRGNFIDAVTDFGRADEFFHHNFLPSYKTNKAGWGNIRYTFCTDANSFRSSCDDQFRKIKKFDVGVIGSSFTEGTGVNFEDSYVGIVTARLNNKKIANLAIALYSSSIYYAKINRLLTQGYKFDEIIIFMDISEVRNETLCYELKDDIVIERKTINSCYGHNPRFHENFKNKLLRLIETKLRLSFKLYKLIENKMIKIGMLKYSAPIKVVDNPEFEWTYNYDSRNYNDFTYEESKKLILNNMQKLSKLLKKNQIELSIAVYPLPGTLKHDIGNNLQVKFWEAFCMKNCKNFFNLMPPFFTQLEKNEFSEVYRKYFFENDVHINEEGHRLIAESFLDLYKE